MSTDVWAGVSARQLVGQSVGQPVCLSVCWSVLFVGQSVSIVREVFKIKQAYIVCRDSYVALIKTKAR